MWRQLPLLNSVFPPVSRSAAHKFGRNVRISFVIFGKQASHLVEAQFFEGQHAQMAVEQKVFRLGGVGLDDGQGFDQANFMDA